MVAADMLTYEKIYFALWEAGQRYGSFVQFRVIGKSHDERMIPMLEIGKGQTCVFCLAGMEGWDRQMPEVLVRMTEEYCRAYECGWKLDEFYEVQRLLDQIRICMIPVLNPDGYEICRRGYPAVRNPIYRQMLQMQNIPYEEFSGNARGVCISGNFPARGCVRRRISQEPASENETKALIRIFQEYCSRGLLSFSQMEKRILYYRKPQGVSYNQRTYRLARHLKNKTKYRLLNESVRRSERHGDSFYGSGSAEQFYGEITRQPALVVQLPPQPPDRVQNTERISQDYDEIHTLPLEYIFSLLE